MSSEELYHFAHSIFFSLQIDVDDDVLLLDSEIANNLIEEDFKYNILHIWDINIIGGAKDCLMCVVTLFFIPEASLDLLEVPMTLPYSSFLLSAIPTVGTLSKRLAPKLVQDPFLNQNGKEYNCIEEMKYK